MARFINKVSIFHARWAGRFAGAADQASVQMVLSFMRWYLSGTYRLNQSDSAARGVAFVFCQFISWAEREAKAAFNTPVSFGNDGVSVHDSVALAVHYENGDCTLFIADLKACGVSKWIWESIRVDN